MNYLIYGAAYVSAAMVFLLAGYALSWYICGVIWNFSPRFRRWFSKYR